MDYNMGEFIKDKLVPNAIGWFTGEALEEEYDDEDGEDEYELGSDEDDDEDEDEDEENAPPTNKAPECKQQ
jgi:nucleosome assembly protein 1-like 1